jgi:hypothetical protein
VSTKRQHNTTADTIRALAGLVVALRHGDSFAITRLTRIKRLCADPQAAAEFARFIARRAQAALRDRSRPERVAPEQWEHYRTLANVGVVQLDAYLADPTAAQATALREQLWALAQAQNTYRDIPYGMLRVVDCWEALLVETAIRCALTPDASARLGYELARDYVERYDPRYGTGLIPESAGPLEEIVDFWRHYHAVSVRA